MNLNMFTLSGRVATDLDLRRTENKGIAVLHFRIAVNHGKDKPTSFFSCEAWDTGAERIAREFKKGDVIYLTGHLRLDTWTGKDNRSMRDVILRVERHGKPLGSHRRAEEEGEAPEQRADDRHDRREDDRDDRDDRPDNNDDIPF